MVISKNHWSWEVRIVSALALMIIIGASLLVIFVDGGTMITKMILPLIFLLTIVISLYWSPRNLSIDQERLTCHTFGSRIEIPLSSILFVTQIEPRDIKTSMRLFGSGGMFGYMGRFRNKKLGNYTMYITERKNLILVTTQTKKYVFNLNLSQGEFNELFTKSK
ncbi:MAG: PH domain-containing protein [Rikenellaceae bacterium]